MMATVLDGGKLKSPGEDSWGEPLGIRTPRLQLSWDMPSLWQKELEGSALRLQMCPEERMVNTEKCGFSTISPCQNNNNNQKANPFICRKTFCPEKGRTSPSPPADTRGEGMRPKTGPFSGICTQKSKFFTARCGVTRSLVYAQRLAHSRHSQNI